MVQFIGNFTTKLRSSIQGLDENNFLRTFYNAGLWPLGRCAIVAALNSQNPNVKEPAILVITQWGDRISRIKEIVKNLVENNAACGGHQKPSHTYRDVTIESAVDEVSAEFSFCFLDDVFIAATDLELLHFVVAHIKGGTGGTLAENADYTSTIEAVGPIKTDGLTACVNVNQLVKIANIGASEAVILGMDNAPAAAASIRFAPTAGYDLEGRAFVKVKGEKKGVCRILDVESSVFKAPRFVPASAYSVAFVNIKLKKAYEQLYQIVSSFSVGLAAAMDTPLVPAGPQGEPGVHLHSDIINHLGSQIIIAENTNNPAAPQPDESETLVAVEVTNRTALEKSLSRLHNTYIMPTNPESQREFLGHTIYVVSLRALPFFGNRPRPMQQRPSPQAVQIPNLAFTVTETHLILGLESTVEAAIRTLSNAEDVSLATAKWFNIAKKAIPSVTGLGSLENNAVSAELFWQTAKEITKTAKSAGAEGPLPIRFGPLLLSELIDPELLPEFETVRQYFGISAFYGISRPDGFFAEYKQLRPQGGQ